MRSRTVLVAVAAVYVVGLAAVLFLRIGRQLNDLTVGMYVVWNLDLHWPGHPLPQDFAFALNIVLFVPVGLLLGLLTRRPWWQVALAATALSAGVEAVQALPFLHRYPSLADVVANGTGGLLGALASTGLLRMRRGGSR